MSHTNFNYAGEWSYYIKDHLGNTRVVLYNTGDTVQIIMRKSSSEGIFIKSANDSGSVYFEKVSFLCWLKKDIILDVEDKNVLTILKMSTPLIFVRKRGDTIIAKYGERKIELENEIVDFNNQSFFESIVKPK